MNGNTTAHGRVAGLEAPSPILFLVLNIYSRYAGEPEQTKKLPKKPAAAWNLGPGGKKSGEKTVADRCRT